MPKEKKFLSKNEFRMDNNPLHFGPKKEPHPAYITINIWLIQLLMQGMLTILKH